MRKWLGNCTRRLIFVPLKQQNAAETSHFFFFFGLTDADMRVTENAKNVSG